jgi:diaminopimelate decarboxylase
LKKLTRIKTSEFDMVKKSIINNILCNHDLMKSSPCLVYAEELIKENVQAYRQVDDCSSTEVKVFYPVKACYDSSVISKVVKSGVDGVEVMSRFELAHVLQIVSADTPIIYTGNHPCERILSLLNFDKDILVVNNLQDAINISNWSTKTGINVRCLVRLFFPNLNQKGMYTNIDSKIGIIPWSSEFFRIVEQLRNNNHFHLVGIHCHQNIHATSAFPYLHAIEKSKNLISFLEKYLGKKIDIINLGGGLDSLPATLIESIVNRIKEQVSKVFPGKKLYLEPGRSIVNSAGIVVASVEGIKLRSGKSYVQINSGSNLLVPTSSARYSVLHPSQSNDGAKTIFSDGVLSPTNIIAENIILPCTPNVGEVVLIGNAGGYTQSIEHQWYRPLHNVYLLSLDGSLECTFSKDRSQKIWEIKYGTNPFME